MHPDKPWEAENALGLFHIKDMWVQVLERGA